MTDAQWKRFLNRSEKLAFENVDPATFKPKKSYADRQFRKGPFLEMRLTPQKRKAGQ